MPVIQVTQLPAPLQTVPAPQHFDPQVVPEVQLHVPPEQAWPLGHALPHWPQLLLLVFRFTQPAAPQSVPVAQTHWLAEQVRLPVQSVPPVKHWTH